MRTHEHYTKSVEKQNESENKNLRKRKRKRNRHKKTKKKENKSTRTLEGTLRRPVLVNDPTYSKGGGEKGNNNRNTDRRTESVCPRLLGDELWGDRRRRG